MKQGQETEQARMRRKRWTGWVTESKKCKLDAKVPRPGKYWLQRSKCLLEAESAVWLSICRVLIYRIRSWYRHCPGSGAPEDRESCFKGHIEVLRREVPGTVMPEMTVEWHMSRPFPPETNHLLYNSWTWKHQTLSHSGLSCKRSWGHETLHMRGRGITCELVKKII